jgi:lysophospholipase L1-like esterase
MLKLVSVVGVAAALTWPGLVPSAQGCIQPPQKLEAKRNTAVVPADRLGDQWWKDRHEHVLELNVKGEAELLFIGDSITQGWEGAGKDVWATRYDRYHAANLGFGGDRTQHVLWRLDQGEVDGFKPKAAVLMIGTNNSNASDNTADEIAAGVKAVVERLQLKHPKMHILLLGVFPRGEKPNPQRDKIASVNSTIAKLDDGKTVHYLDIGGKFLQPDGSISKEIMPDFLHLSPKGYQIWADAIEPKLGELMK